MHRFFEDENPEDQYGKQFRDTVANTEIPITKILREHHRPQIELEETNYGIRIKTLRHLERNQTHVRITNQIFPCAISIPMSNTMTITQWHVPINDHNCFWYAMFTSFSEPVDKKKMRDQRLAEHTLPNYLPIRNKTNQYGYNAEEQEKYTYTGMGMDINVHDQWACESMGPIQDRTEEHLGTTDKAISAYRRLLIQTISKVEKGRATDLLFSASQGLVASVTGPFGRLVIPQSLPPRIILVATSVGIAPYLPMLRQLEIPLAAGEVQLTFLFGARDASEILYADFLVDYQQKYAASVDFRVSLSRDMAVSEPSIASYVHPGYVQQQLAQLELDASKDLVMLCGNPAMVDECFDLLKHEGFGVRQVIREKYVFAKDPVSQPTRKALTDEQRKLIAEKMNKYSR